MNKFKRNGWIFNIDEEKMNSFYDKYTMKLDNEIYENFYYCIDEYSVGLNEFLENINIDINKPSMIYNFGIDKKSKLIDYAAYYIVFGNAEGQDNDIIIDNIKIKINKDDNLDFTKEFTKPYFVVEIYNIFLSMNEIDNVDELYPTINKKSIVIERIKQAFNK